MASIGASPALIGAAVAWLCTDPAAEQHRGQIVLAQKLTDDHGLLDSST